VQHPLQLDRNQSQPDGNDSPRLRRLRARRARRRVFSAIGLAMAAVLTLLAGTVAVVVVALHVGIRPVLTGSMRPDYGPGAVLLTRQVPTTSLKPGMIVLIIPPGEHAPYAHRIATVSGTRAAPVITTKGDANKAVDPWHAKITARDVSVVIGSLPGIGRLLVGLRGSGQIVLAGAGILMVSIACVRWLLTPSTRPPSRRMTPGSA